MLKKISSQNYGGLKKKLLTLCITLVFTASIAFAIIGILQLRQKSDPEIRR